MDPVSSADRLAIILRQRLAERLVTPKGGRGSVTRTGSDATPRGLDGVRALAGVEDLSDSHVRRALIQAILSDQFGSRMINDAQFQQLVAKVAETMEGEDESALLLDQMVGELRDKAGSPGL